MSEPVGPPALDYATPVHRDPARGLLRRVRPLLSNIYVLAAVGGLLLISSEQTSTDLDWRVWLVFWGLPGVAYLIAAAVRGWRTTRGRPVRRGLLLTWVTFVWLSTGVAWQTTPTHVFVLIKPVPYLIVVRGWVGPMPNLSSLAGERLGLSLRYWFRPEDFSPPLLP